MNSLVIVAVGVGSEFFSYCSGISDASDRGSNLQLITDKLCEKHTQLTS